MASYYRTWTDGEVVTATNVQDYLQKGVVVQCDSSADYPTGREGMVVYDKALDAYLGYTGSAWVRIVPLTTTAVQTWTPTLTQSSAVTATVTEARYVRSGCIVQAWGVLAVTGSGTSGNAVTVSLPVTASGHSANAAIGNGVILESSANDQTLVVVRLDTTSTVSFMSTETTQGRWGVFPSKGLATGDSVQFNVRYTV